MTIKPLSPDPLVPVDDVAESSPGMNYEAHVKTFNAVLGAANKIARPFEIVERRVQRELRERRWNSRRIRKAERRDPRSRSHEEGVRVSVVTPLEFQDTFAADDPSPE